MPIGSTFGQVVQFTQEEAGHYISAALNKNVLSQVQQAVRRTYRRLHGEHNWPHLRTQRDVLVGAGERYVAFPPDLDPDRTEEVWVVHMDTQRWTRLGYGIGLAEMQHLNSDLFDYQDPGTYSHGSTGPPARWQRSPLGPTLFEVWPIQHSGASTVRFVGITRPNDLSADNSIVDLDDDMIALYAAAEILARQKSDDASIKLEQAQVIYRRLRANSQNPGEPFRLNPERPRWQGVTVRAPR